MNRPDLHGIFPALATPMHTDGQVDEAGLRRLVEHLAPHVEGFVVNGTTGDFPLLTRDERRRTVEIVAEAVGGTHLVIAGTGAIATDEAIALTRDAHESGAAATLIVAPYYLRPTPAGLLAHYRAIAGALPDLPILLYNFPQLVGQPIPVDVVAALASETENVVGLKDTSGDMRYMLSILETAPDGFAVLVGQGTLVLPALAMGATGAILAAGNLIPEAYQAMRRSIAENDWEAARFWQHRTYPVARLVGRFGSLAVRAGLELLELPAGPPRSPLTLEGTLTQEDLQELQRGLDYSSS